MFLSIIMSVSSASAAVSNPGVVSLPKDDRTPCESALMALQHWAAQLYQESISSKTSGACQKELSLSEQSFPRLNSKCAKLTFSEMSESVQKDWTLHAWKGAQNPDQHTPLGTFSEAYRVETLKHISATCKTKSAHRK